MEAVDSGVVRSWAKRFVVVSNGGVDVSTSLEMELRGACGGSWQHLLESRCPVLRPFIKAESAVFLAVNSGSFSLIGLAAAQAGVVFLLVAVGASRVMVAGGWVAVFGVELFWG